MIPKEFRLQLEPEFPSGLIDLAIDFHTSLDELTLRKKSYSEAYTLAQVQMDAIFNQLRVRVIPQIEDPYAVTPAVLAELGNLLAITKALTDTFPEVS